MIMTYAWNEWLLIKFIAYCSSFPYLPICIDFKYEFIYREPDTMIHLCYLEGQTKQKRIVIVLFIK